MIFSFQQHAMLTLTAEIGYMRTSLNQFSYQSFYVAYSALLAPVEFTETFPRSPCQMRQLFVSQ